MVSADQSGEDRREHGAPEDRIMVHVIRNEKTVAHANESIRHGEADRTRDEGPGAVNLRPRGFSHDRGQNDAAVAAISIADCVAPYRGKSTMPERRYQTDPTVVNAANTAHQYAANRARNASAMIMPSTAPPMAIEAKTNGCSWHPPG